jgi:hypothetical protein
MIGFGGLRSMTDGKDLERRRGSAMLISQKW